MENTTKQIIELLKKLEDFEKENFKEKSKNIERLFNLSNIIDDIEEVEEILYSYTLEPIEYQEKEIDGLIFILRKFNINDEYIVTIEIEDAECEENEVYVSESSYSITKTEDGIKKTIYVEKL